MCGIFCSLGTTHHILPNDDIKRRLINRGPDSINSVETLYPRTTAQKHDTSTRDISVTLCSTVLSLRGSLTVTQPYQDSEGKYTLCWNGEAWSINGEPMSGNDTKAIHRLPRPNLNALPLSLSPVPESFQKHFPRLLDHTPLCSSTIPADDCSSAVTF
jgi:hypothetical protein